MDIKLPYPYYGGKSTIMSDIWKRLGDTPNFVDPFMGGNAPLLSRPHWDWHKMAWVRGTHRIETINDIDGYVTNFQRGIKHDPAGVAEWASDGVSELDLHARHQWLVNRHDFIEAMRSDPDYYDVKIAGWWVWGICQWIGGGWCYYPKKQQLPHLGNAGMGLHRPSQQRPHLGDAGMGIHRPWQQRPHLGDAGRVEELTDYFSRLSARLQRVRICCGDWTRVLGFTPTEANGLTAIILDPPYGKAAERVENIYANDSLTVADDVRGWALENGDNPKLRIALCGYLDEHDEAIPDTWQRLRWSTQGGYSNRNANGNDNKHKEVVWFSPHCLKVESPNQLSLLEI